MRALDRAPAGGPARSAGGVATLVPLRARRLAGVRLDRRRLAAAGLELALALGTSLLTFVAFQFWVTDLSQDRAQRSLARSFAAEVVRAEVLSSSGTAEEVASLSRPAVGEAVAVLRIPRIGVKQVVVEGSGSEQLRAGPGHLRATPLPGHRGNAVVLGHRTIYGAPFERLDELRRGDGIDVATPLASFRFEVKDVVRVAPGRPDPVTAKGGRAITLVTSDPPRRASGRLVVLAEAPAGLRLADAGDTGRPARVSDHERGLRADAGARWPALLWGVLLLAAYALHRAVRRHLTGPTAWLVGAPILLAVAFVWFEQLNRLLPSTL